MGSPASRWIAVSAPSPMPRRTCTACFRRASSLASADRRDLRDRRARGPSRALFAVAVLLAAFSVARTARAEPLRLLATTCYLARLSRVVVGDVEQVAAITP